MTQKFPKLSNASLGCTKKTTNYGQCMGKLLAFLEGVIGGFFVIYLAIACIYSSQAKRFSELA